MDLLWLLAAIAFFSTSGLAIRVIGQLQKED